MIAPLILAHCEEPITVEWSKLDVARSADVEASAVSCAVWALSSEGRAEVLEPSSALETGLKGRWVLAGGLLMSFY